MPPDVVRSKESADHSGAGVLLRRPFASFSSHSLATFSFAISSSWPARVSQSECRLDASLSALSEPFDLCGQWR